MLKLTTAGKHYRNSAMTEGFVYQPTKFVFSLVPGLDPNSEPDDNITLPDVSKIVYEHVVTHRRKLDEDHILFSVMLGSEIGDFDFNRLDLVNDANEVLMVTFGPVIPKRAANINTGQEGNTLARTFSQIFSGAANLAQITITAESWQYDFSNEFNQVIYGQAVALESLSAVHIKQFDFNKRLEAIKA